MIKIVGSYVLDASPAVVWPRVFEPRSLVALIPGCQELEEVSPNEYRGRMALGLAALSGSFQIAVRILEANEPSFCRFEGEVSGAPGTATGTASFSLQEREMDSRTQLDYAAEGQLSGGLTLLPSRFIEGVVQTLLKQGLAKLNTQLTTEEV